MTKQETLPEGVAGVKFVFPKLFSRVRVLCRQYLITNHIESILKSKIMSTLMNIFVVGFYLILLKNILKCNCSLFYLDDNIFT